MKNIDYVTVKAAHKFIAGNGPKAPAYVSLAEVSELVYANTPKPKRQGWSFIGNWKRVQPYFNAV